MRYHLSHSHHIKLPRKILLNLTICPVLVVLFLSQTAWPDRIRPLTLKQIVNSAGMILEGECTKVTTGKDPKSGMISTWYTFRVEQGIKGEIDETITLKQYGGSDGEQTITVHTATYTVGEKVVLFLYGKSKIGFSSAVGFQQGKFRMVEHPETKIKFVTNGVAATLLFPHKDSALVTLKANGLKAVGSQRLTSNRLERISFLLEVKRLVQEEKKAKELKQK